MSVSTLSLISFWWCRRLLDVEYCAWMVKTLRAVSNLPDSHCVDENWFGTKHVGAPPFHMEHTRAVNRLHSPAAISMQQVLASPQQSPC